MHQCHQQCDMTDCWLLLALILALPPLVLLCRLTVTASEI